MSDNPLTNDPYAHVRDPALAEARAGLILCSFHERNPDVGDDYDDPDLAGYCPDCEVERYYADPATYEEPGDEAVGFL